MVTIRLTDCRLLTGRFDALLPLLDGARRERAGRYGDTPRGRQCLAAGLLLRAAFGPDNHKRIRIGPYGKPYIPGQREFCLSHAGDYAALATADAAVGVDIERMRRLDGMGIARRFFHPDEQAFVREAGDPNAAFLTVWTLKESYVKAEGSGFFRPPTAYCILPEGDGAARMAGESAYRFRRYPAPEGYALSVCSLDGAFPERIEWIELP